MNPSIIGGKFDENEWRGDPSESALVRFFGGVPVDLDDQPDPEPDPPTPPTGGGNMDGFMTITDADTGLATSLTMKDGVGKFQFPNGYRLVKAEG